MKFIKEPLVQFLVLAILLFALDHILSASRKTQIIVNQQTVEYLIKQREELLLRKLSAHERKEVISAYVDDEILYSEAYKRNLDKSDSRMRRNMLLKMRGLLIGDMKEPTEKELHAYFEANREKFITPASLTLDHVFYGDIENVPQTLHEQLQTGADHRKFGEFKPGLGSSIPGLSQKLLAVSFGPDTARAILAIEDEHWHGPFESKHGIHFVRITKRTPANQAAYKGVRHYLEPHWAMEESRRIIAEEVERLRNNYEVIIDMDDESAF